MIKKHLKPRHYKIRKCLTGWPRTCGARHDGGESVSSINYKYSLSTLAAVTIIILTLPSWRALQVRGHPENSLSLKQYLYHHDGATVIKSNPELGF